MDLPFTTEQFIEVFINYNTAVWPMQVLFDVMAIVAIALAFRTFPHSDRLISGILGVLWLWTGVVYHWTFFTAVNPGASVFGTMCVVQGGLFLMDAARNRILYRAAWHWRGILGSIFLLYGLLVYPILGNFLGHAFPGNPTFGAPCPTTIFTFGMLLWARNVPRYLSVIPALWSLVGSSAAFSLGIREDIGLLVAGVVGTCVLWVSYKPEVTIATAR